MKISPRQVAVALQLVAEAQELLNRAELRLPKDTLPALLRELAEKLEKSDADRAE